MEPQKQPLHDFRNQFREITEELKRHMQIYHDDLIARLDLWEQGRDPSELPFPDVTKPSRAVDS